MFHLALHTVVTGTREGAADFYAVNGGNDETSGPLRAEYSVALQLTGEITAESENGTGILPFEGVPDGVFTKRADPFGERTSGIPFRSGARQGTDKQRPETPRQRSSSRCVVETGGHRAKRLLLRRNQTPCRDRSRTGVGRSEEH